LKQEVIRPGVLSDGFYHDELTRVCSLGLAV